MSRKELQVGNLSIHLSSDKEWFGEGSAPTTSTSTPQPKKPKEDWVMIDSQAQQEINTLNQRIQKTEKYQSLLSQPQVDLDKLRKLSWNGVPEEFRSRVWQLLMNYLPSNQSRRDSVLLRRRQEYQWIVNQNFSSTDQENIPLLDQTLWHQIHIDVPRTCSTLKLFQNKKVQAAIERILSCFAVRHPASGYVQGMNDLVCPFFVTFLSDYEHGDLYSTAVELELDDSVLNEVEADTFWCLSKLLDGIQDNYTSNQPGIHKQIKKLKELVGRLDQPLLDHLQSQGIEFIQFAFRWMNCLLMRELPLQLIVRMWDTYIAEGDFSEFHVYVSAAFLCKWSSYLQKCEFQELIMFLQCLPTTDWRESNIEVLLSEAFMWNQLYHNAPNHLTPKETPSHWSI